MAVRPSSPADNPSRTRTKAMVIGAVAALVLAMGLFGGNDTASDTASSDAPRPSRPAHTAAAAPPAAQPAAKHLPRSRPVRLLIPKISVDAPFTELAIGRTGQLEPPPADDTNLVGWHAKGA
ncbi:sortase, partial [Streptomyces sp. WM6386]